MSSSSSSQASFDPSRQHLGLVYAAALLGAAQSQGVVREVLEQLDSLVDDVLTRLPKLEAVLASPRIELDKKISMLDRAFAGKMAPLLLTFLKIVAEKRRLDCLREIRAAAHHQANTIAGRVEVQLWTAQDISQPEIDAITARLTTALGQEVVTSHHVDPELLGGIQIRIGDTVFDGSLSNQLKQMKAAALGRTAEHVRDSSQRFVAADS